MAKKRSVLRGGQFQEVPEHEVDVELTSPNQFFSTHANLIPLQSAVAGPRVFYGARFVNQAMPVVGAEAPLVQALDESDPEGRSFDAVLGEHAGAHRAKAPGVVDHVSDDAIDVHYDDGQKDRFHLYRDMPFNRKTKLNHTALVRPGDKVARGQTVAKSNYTDDQGTLAMGLNARIGLVPYHGYSMDDAVVISEDFARRLKSSHLYGFDTDYKRGVKGGKNHYVSVFPNKFTNKQLEPMDEDGVVQPGTIIQPGDPLILSTRPRVISSTSAQLGQLSRHMKNARTDAATLWDQHQPGRVTDVKKLRSGVKVNVETELPTELADKLTLRSGQKGVVAKIIPTEQVPRTADGKPLDMLLNPLSIPSRVNNSLIYELLLGKIAAHRGEPYVVPAFNKPGEKWHDFVAAELVKHGLSDTEEVFDPSLNRKLENPILVGNGLVQKLHHTAHSKLSVRGQGSYDANEQPAHGGSELAHSKRLSGLESNALLSSGAYNVLREGATLRGARNDDYWRTLRAGHEPKEPGEPFVWNKMLALLSGSGYIARKLPQGKYRLGYFTDSDLDQHNPLEVQKGDIVDLDTLEPVKDGLFDPAITGGGRWAQISLPEQFPNPAAESAVLKLLGLTRASYRNILAGKEELPPHLQMGPPE